jgi:hypothetical protein
VRVRNDGSRQQNNDYNMLNLKISKVPIVNKVTFAVNYGNLLHFRILSPPVEIMECI